MVPLNGDTSKSVYTQWGRIKCCSTKLGTVFLSFLIFLAGVDVYVFFSTKVCNGLMLLKSRVTENVFYCLFFFFAFDFCRFCVGHTRSYPLHYFLILILEIEPVFSFSMLSAKQGNYWCHFYIVFGMTWSLTGNWTLDLPHSMPALYH